MKVNLLVGEVYHHRVQKKNFEYDHNFNNVFNDLILKVL